MTDYYICMASWASVSFWKGGLSFAFPTSLSTEPAYFFFLGKTELKP